MRGYFLFFAILLFLQAETSKARAGDVLAGPVEAEVLRVIDGDTIAVRARIWLGQTVEVDVRLAGIDAPELHGACPRERADAVRARDQLLVMTRRGEVHLTDIRRDKYGGRVVAHVWGNGGSGSEDFSAILEKRGLARAYRGGARGGWCGVAMR